MFTLMIIIWNLLSLSSIWNGGYIFSAIILDVVFIALIIVLHKKSRSRIRK